MAAGAFPAPNPTSGRDSVLYRDALALFAGLSDAELAGCLNALRHELADCADLAPEHRAVCEVLVGDRLAAAEAIGRRRAARFMAGAGPDPSDAFSSAWRD